MVCVMQHMLVKIVWRLADAGREGCLKVLEQCEYSIVLLVSYSPRGY